MLNVLTICFIKTLSTKRFVKSIVVNEVSYSLPAMTIGYLTPIDLCTFFFVLLILYSS